MKYIEGIDYWVRRREFPCTTIFAWAVSLGDGTFDIWLNTRVSEEKQREGLLHDLKHLEDNHFYRDDLTLAQKETIAWGAVNAPDLPVQTKPIKPEPLPFPIQPQEPVKKPAAPASRPDPDKIVTTGQLFAMAAKIRHNRETKKPWKLDKSKLDIWAE